MGDTGRVADLVRLSDTTFTLADPAEDVRNRTVIDADGEEIGHVHDLFIDEEEKSARFLQVASGGVLGIGAQHFLVPVEAVAEIEDDRVHISRNRERLLDVPTYDPDLADHRNYYADLYGWWGYAPYGAAGYGFAPPPPLLPPPPPPDSSEKRGEGGQ